MKDSLARYELKQLEGRFNDLNNRYWNLEEKHQRLLRHFNLVETTVPTEVKLTEQKSEGKK